MTSKQYYEINEAKLMIQIESFTQKVVDRGLERKDLSKLVRLLDNFARTFSCNHRYTDYVGIFASLATDLDGYKDIENGYTTHASLLKIEEYKLNEISKLCRSRKSKALAELRQYRKRAKKRLDILNYKVKKLFDNYSRHLVVRVDLKYKSSKQGNIDIEQFDYHLDKLLQLLSQKNTCFENLKFYSWCLEQAPKGGYHVHLFLMYDGSKATHDIKLAEWVGETWQNKITEGQGWYWNCNYNKDQYSKRTIKQGKVYLNGLGMIKRNDPIGFERLKNVYSYFARVTDEKLDQRLRIRMKGMRAFGCTQVK